MEKDIHRSYVMINRVSHKSKSGDENKGNDSNPQPQLDNAKMDTNNTNPQLL